MPFPCAMIIKLFSLNTFKTNHYIISSYYKMSQETQIGNLGGGISDEDAKLVDSILNDINSTGTQSAQQNQISRTKYSSRTARSATIT